jgi:hypothetical protein
MAAAAAASSSLSSNNLQGFSTTNGGGFILNENNRLATHPSSFLYVRYTLFTFHLLDDRSLLVS